MRRLVYWNLVTLDGCFEGPRPWDLGFHDYAWGEELSRVSLEMLEAADGILFGRVTYEGMAAYWPTAKGAVAEHMNRIPKTVFSRTLEEPDWENSRVVRGSAEEEVARLRAEPGRDLLMFGSGKLGASLSRAGLIDEYRLGVVPVVLGGGTPLFRPGPELRLELIEARPLGSGAVILRYRPR